MDVDTIPVMVAMILPQLPHLLGILLVAGAGIWGLTRPRKAAGALALAGAGLAALIWLVSGSMSLLPVLASTRRSLSLAQIGAIVGASGCVIGVLDLIVWALIAAALFVAIRGQKGANE